MIIPTAGKNGGGKSNNFHLTSAISSHNGRVDDTMDTAWYTYSTDSFSEKESLPQFFLENMPMEEIDN